VAGELVPGERPAARQRQEQQCEDAQGAEEEAGGFPIRHR
jgi:hypothetical protein